MSDPSEPPAIHQKPSNPDDISLDCPFCTITTAYQPIRPTDLSNQEWDPDKLQPPSYVLLSTEHVVAFLDIAPLTRGHVLVAPRKHRTKVGDMSGVEMAEIGRLLPILARSVIKSVLPDIPHDEADYNIVQNNGPGAAQVIPHVHFHIIPRPPLNYQRPSPPPPPPQTSTSTSTTTSKLKSKYPPSTIPTGLQRSYIQFGRGRRHELDDDDAVELVKTMRGHVREEWEKEVVKASSSREAESSGGGDSSRGKKEEEERKEEGIERFMGGAEDAAWIEGSGGLVRNLERRARGNAGKL